MSELGSERSKPWNIYSTSDPAAPSQTGEIDREAPWKSRILPSLHLKKSPMVLQNQDHCKNLEILKQFQQLMHQIFQ
ncbi:hypothetical protein OIU79_007682 [Salix purpurea]|uniref:Uncharacterized protein n=1 Tax=Salix purpurea TaxID=77065 RepID=A0A9Q0YV51_SALPP|nr:hypothetical protein OIU79_007682 [Salix purpurea]